MNTLIIFALIMFLNQKLDALSPEDREKCINDIKEHYKRK
jgi:uncharacterized membrane protein